MVIVSTQHCSHRAVRRHPLCEALAVPLQIYLTYYQQFETERMQLDGRVITTNQSFYDMTAEYLAVGELQSLRYRVFCLPTSNRIRVCTPPRSAAANILHLEPQTVTATQPDVYFVVANSPVVQYTLNYSITYRYISNVIDFQSNSSLETVRICKHAARSSTVALRRYIIARVLHVSVCVRAAAEDGCTASDRVSNRVCHRPRGCHGKAHAHWLCHCVSEVNHCRGWLTQVLAPCTCDTVTLQIEREKSRIYGMFMLVPMQVIKRLASQAQKSLEQMQNVLANQDQDALIGDHDGDGPGHGALADEEEQRVDWSEIKLKSVKARAVSKDYTWSSMLCVKLSIPLLICIVSLHWH